jgi:hypothetical protein
LTSSSGNRVGAGRVTEAAREPWLHRYARFGTKRRRRGVVQVSEHVEQATN